MTDATQGRRPLDVATDVLARADGDEVRVLATHQRDGLTRFAESHIHQHVGEDATHVQLTVVRDGRVAVTSTTDTSRSGLDRLVARANEIVEVAPIDRGWPGLAGHQDVKDPGHASPDTLEATGEQRAEVVKGFVRAGGANAAGYCETQVHTCAVVDTAGAAVQQQRTRATLDGIQRLADGSAGAGHQSAVSLADLDGEQAGVHARRLADLGSVRVDLDPGRLPVVLGPEAAGTLAIFLATYGFNGKMHTEGQSGIRLGDHQFDATIDLVDDPLGSCAIGFGFDLEGTARRRLSLIAEGRCDGLAHDRRSAAEAGTTSTGHHSEWSGSHGALPENLVLSTSSSGTGVPVAEMAAGMERGLVITSFNYCRLLDSKSIGVTGLTRNGTFLVEDGHIIGSVGNLRFTQSFLAALAPGAVLAVGDDGRMSDNEFGPGMTWTPSLHLASWNITGDVRG